jgi:hypothetical protein
LIADFGGGQTLQTAKNVHFIGIQTLQTDKEKHFPRRYLRRMWEYCHHIHITKLNIINQLNK